MRSRTFLAFVFVFLFLSAFTHAATLYSRATGNWGAGATWSTIGCGGAQCLCIPTITTDIVNLCGAYTVTVASTYNSGGTVNLSAGTLIIPGGVTLTVVNLNMTGGTLTVNGTLNVTGSFTRTAGTFTAPGTATGTVGFTGGVQTLPIVPYYNLNIAGFGNKTLSAGTTVVYNTLYLTTNNLIVGSNTLQLGSATNGNGINQTSGKLDISSGTSNLMFGGGTYNYNLSSIFSTAAPWTLATLTMMRNLATVTADGNLTITGAFTTYNGGSSLGGNMVIGAGRMVTFNGPVNMSRTCFCNEITGGSTSDITIGGSSGQVAGIYFDLGTTSAGGTNTIRNFMLNRTGMTFYPLSSLRIGNLLTLAAGTKFSVANNTTVSSLNTLTFDGVGNSWTGTGEFVGSSYLTSAYIYVYGSGVLTTPLTFNTASASNYTLTGLSIDRPGSPVLQLGTNLNLLSSLTFRNAFTTNGSLDINGKVIDMGASGIIYNENSSERIFCSVCPANSTSSYINASMNLAAGTTYTGVAGSPSQTGYRGLGLEIITDAVAPGATSITRGFSDRSGGALASSVLRYFEISPATNTGMNATLTFHYWDSEGNSLVEADMGLYRDNTGANDWADRGGVSTPGSGDNLVTLAAIDQFSPWTAGKHNVTLPVDLLSFSTNCNLEEVIVNWTTATETNNDAFYVERSLDNEKWELLGAVDGAGNSNKSISYSLTDDHPFKGTNYYRLMQMDFNGAFKYYGPVAANCNEINDNNDVIIYPNPTSGSIYMQSGIVTSGKIILTDITGRIIVECSRNDLSETFNISLNDLIPGMYLVRIESEGFLKTYKVVKQ